MDTDSLQRSRPSSQKGQPLVPGFASCHASGNAQSYLHFSVLLSA